MSKRLLVLFTIVLVMVTLAPSAIAFAQEEPVFVLTEEQINADFTIPSTAARSISNLEVDVQEDGVHISFELTTVRDGTSNTVSIIAILIGLYQPRVTHLSFYDLLISSFTPSRTVRREVTNLLTGAWSDYVKGAIAESSLSLNFTKITYLMESEGINFYLTDTDSSESESVGWCLECAKP